jgi:hypothetical protein
VVSARSTAGANNVCCGKQRVSAFSMTKRFSIRIKSTAIFVHRWLGVCLCMLFLLWFVSGVAMMYCDYPEVSAADHLAHEGMLNASQIRLSPQDAFAQLKSEEPPESVRLVQFDGRPAYRFRNRGTESIVYADTGEALTSCLTALTLRIDSAWAGQPAATAKQEINTEEDQWTVSGSFARFGHCGNTLGRTVNSLTSSRRRRNHTRSARRDSLLDTSSTIWTAITHCRCR